MANQPPLLEVNNLHVQYQSAKRHHVAAVNGISLRLNQGEVVAIVGESGSGKSTSAHAILGLLPPSATMHGSISLAGQELVGLNPRGWREVRGQDIAFIPQDPTSSLNPTRRVGAQIAEAITTHDRLISQREVQARVHDLLDKVGIPQPALRARQYPHELSGGMRQRVLIAAALASSPRLIIADEPTSALDVTVQQQILDHIDVLRTELDLALLLITHDLGVASDRADHIIVMSQGEVVEQGSPQRIIASPESSYTQALVAAVPMVHQGRLRWDATAQRAIPEGTRSPARNPAKLPGSFPIGGIDGLPTSPILTATALDKTFRTGKSHGRIRAVQDVSLSVQRGQTLGVVGESGSGKSTLARMLAHLTAPDAGRIHLEGQDITHLRGGQLRELRRHIQLVYQNPFTSIDPRFTIAQTLAEPQRAFKMGDRRSRQERSVELLNLVGLPAHFMERKPAQLSGGQLQRVAIARALAAKPSLIILDEAVSALDVSVQAQILQLLVRLQTELHLSMVFISHDLAVIRQVSDSVAVMHGGELVDYGSAGQIFNAPSSPVTLKLLAAVPGKHLTALAKHSDLAQRSDLAQHSDLAAGPQEASTAGLPSEVHLVEEIDTILSPM